MKGLTVASHLAAILAASVMAFSASAASAQSESAAPPVTTAPATEAAKDSRTTFLSDPITVEAKRETAKQRALSLIHDYSGKKHYWEALAAWDDDICVAVAGLDPGKNAAVKARIEAVATTAGATVKQGRCGPEHVQANLEVFFTPDPDRLLKAIARERPWIVGGVQTRAHPLIAVRAYEAGLVMKRPIEAWYTTNCAPDIAPIAPAGRMSGNFGYGRQFWLSDWGPCQKIGFDNVLVVVDERRIPGMTLDVLTDYAAMLALTQPISLNGCNALPSIIDLFSAACSGNPEPTGLTESDTAYLRGLYSGGQLLPPGWQAPGDIANRMANLLVPVSGPAR